MNQNRNRTRISYEERIIIANMLSQKQTLYTIAKKLDRNKCIAIGFLYSAWLRTNSSGTGYSDAEVIIQEKQPPDTSKRT